MLESIKFRPLGKPAHRRAPLRQAPAAARRRQALCLALGLILAVAAAAALWGPASAALRRFRAAFRRIASDFAYSASREYSDCNVYLWTRRSARDPHVLRGLPSAADLLDGSTFDPARPVKLLFHGFSDAASTSWTRAVKRAYLKEGDYNVFSVDWRALARSPWYSTAAKNAE